MISVSMPDGSETPVRLFPGGRKIVVIWPGFGVGARYYDPMARELVDRGFSVAIGELRGQGASTARAARGEYFGYQTAAKSDYPLVIDAVRRELGDGPLSLLCHSMGGQIASLYLCRPEAREQGVSRAVFVGSGSPHFRHFSGREYRRLRFGMPLMRSVSRVCGFWPGGRLDIAGYGRQSARHIAEWSNFVATDRLVPLRPDVDYAALMAEATPSILFTRCVDDADCPEASARALMRLLPSAETEFYEIPERLGHNRWARTPEAVASLVEKWS